MGLYKKGKTWLKKNVGGTLTSGGSKMKGHGMIKIKMSPLKMRTKKLRR